MDVEVALSVDVRSVGLRERHLVRQSSTLLREQCVTIPSTRIRRFCETQPGEKDPSQADSKMRLAGRYELPFTRGLTGAMGDSQNLWPHIVYQIGFANFIDTKKEIDFKKVKCYSMR